MTILLQILVIVNQSQHFNNYTDVINLIMLLLRLRFSHLQTSWTTTLHWFTVDHKNISYSTAKLDCFGLNYYIFSYVWIQRFNLSLFQPKSTNEVCSSSYLGSWCTLAKLVGMRNLYRLWLCLWGWDPLINRAWCQAEIQLALKHGRKISVKQHLTTVHNTTFKRKPHVYF